LKAPTAGSPSGRYLSGRSPASQSGQGVVEYGLILAIMILVCVIALVFFGDQLAAILDFIASKV
jgi:Flp pilus assembly pilin Flp